MSEAFDLKTVPDKDAFSLGLWTNIGYLVIGHTTDDSFTNAITHIWKFIN